MDRAADARHAYSRSLFHYRNTKPTRQRIVDDTIGGRREEAAPWEPYYKDFAGEAAAGHPYENRSGYADFAETDDFLAELLREQARS